MMMPQLQELRAPMLGRMVKLLISLCFYPFLLLRRHAAALFRQELRPPHVILLYHQVADSERQAFANQMDLLLRIGEPVPLDQIGLSEGKGKRLQIAVTFDDGIRNILQNGIPELLERRIAATVFYPTGYFGRFPGWMTHQDPADESRWVMSIEEARRLPSDLIGAGSHTVSHSKLTRLRPDELLAELRDSKHDLEIWLGRPVETVAFPYGDFDEKVVRSSQEAGYQRAFAADPIRIEGYVLGRIDTSPSDWPLEFYLKAVGAYRWLSIAIHLKRLLLRKR